MAEVATGAEERVQEVEGTAAAAKAAAATMAVKVGSGAARLVARMAVVPGSIVRVPLGPRHVYGVVWGGAAHRPSAPRLRTMSSDGCWAESWSRPLSASALPAILLISSSLSRSTSSSGSIAVRWPPSPLHWSEQSCCVT